MDIEMLIEQLRKSANFEDYPIVAGFAAIIEKKYLRAAADALEELQAENEEMQKKLNEFSEFLCHRTTATMITSRATSA